MSEKFYCVECGEVEVDEEDEVCENCYMESYDGEDEDDK